MTEAERHLLVTIARHIAEGWPGSPMANDIEAALHLLELEDAEAADREDMLHQAGLEAKYGD